MKIVQVINSLSYRGGAQTFFENLCDAFSHIQNIELHVILMYDMKHESFSRFFANTKIKFYCCYKKHSFDLLASKRLKKILKSIQPDIVNFHLSFLVSYFIAFGYRKQKWKLIKTFHSIPGKDSNKFDYFIEKRYIRKNLLDLISISPEIFKIAKELYPTSNCININNGIVINGIDEESNNLNNQKKYDFIIVASLEKVKNHKLLFDAISKIDDEISVLCLGDGTCRKEYEMYINKIGISNKISLYGAVDNVADFLSLSKCLILCSTREGNPISILEAMAAGLPVIASRVGGIPDIVKHEINGLLFESQNVDELIECMKKIKNDEKRFSIIGKNNKEFVKQFSIENTVEGYYKFYNKILGGASGETKKGSDNR